MPLSHKPCQIRKYLDVPIGTSIVATSRPYICICKVIYERNFETPYSVSSVAPSKL